MKQTNNNIEMKEAEFEEIIPAEEFVEEQPKESKLANLCKKGVEKAKAGGKFVWNHKKEIAIAGGTALAAFVAGMLIASKDDEEYDESNYIVEDADWKEIEDEPALLETTVDENDELAVESIDAEIMEDVVEAE